MGLIDLNFYQEAPVASVIEVVASCITAGGAIGTVVLAYMAYLQNRQTKLDSVIPHCNIKFTVMSNCLYVELKNNGLGPLILTGDPIYSFNGQPLVPSRTNLCHILFPNGDPGGQFIRRSLHQNDSLRVGEDKLIIEFNFANRLNDNQLTHLRNTLVQGHFTLYVPYRSIYHVDMTAEKVYANNHE